MSSCSDRQASLHGYVDGELDAANCAAFEAHLSTCADCTAEAARVTVLRNRLRAADLRYAAPRGWRETALGALPTQPGFARDEAPSKSGPRSNARAPVPGRAGPFIAGGGLGLAAGLVLALSLPSLWPQTGQDQVVASHVRSLLAQHLTDVASSDRHQVRPWFNGRIDFAPPTPDLAPQGFPLAGGRLDYLDGRVVAAVVYRRRLHPLNLFVRPAAAATPEESITSKADGYNLVRWRQGDLEFWVVSDLNAKELKLFQRYFVAATSG